MNEHPLRTIILHYHLFKNAGTSVDAILKRNFGDKWVTREFPPLGGSNTELVQEWIRETPEAIAYSSHTMMGPIPRVEGVRVVSFILLRDPLERIKSAYRFERTQQADTWGAQLAKENDFEGYVRKRLSRSGDRQCRNFQTYRLASLAPGEGSEKERAIRGLSQLTVIGRLDAFSAAISQLENEIKSVYPHAAFDYVKENISDQRQSVEVSSEFLLALKDSNLDDLDLLQLPIPRLAPHDVVHNPISKPQ